RASLARRDHKAGQAAAELAEAERIAAEENVDPDLVHALLETSVPADLAHYDTVLDGRSHELRLKKKTISFQKRPVLRKLLYALASRPGAVFPKETLVERMWSANYSPLQHDNPLWVNVRRLRLLLAKTGLVV